MMKALLPSLAAAGLGAVMAATVLAGCAAQPTRTAAVATAANCVKDTGSRIQAAGDKCANVAGSAYSQTDIERTGEIGTAAALRKLDPRFN